MLACTEFPLKGPQYAGRCSVSSNMFKQLSLNTNYRGVWGGRERGVALTTWQGGEGHDKESVCAEEEVCVCVSVTDHTFFKRSIKSSTSFSSLQKKPRAMDGSRPDMCIRPKFVV